MDGAGGNHLERAMHEKRPIPEIDFTLHTMEDGTQVSTQERVCKGIDTSPLLTFPLRSADRTQRYRRQRSIHLQMTSSSLPMIGANQISSISSSISTAKVG